MATERKTTVEWNNNSTPRKKTQWSQKLKKNTVYACEYLHFKIWNGDFLCQVYNLFDRLHISHGRENDIKKHIGTIKHNQACVNSGSSMKLFSFKNLIYLQLIAWNTSLQLSLMNVKCQLVWLIMHWTCFPKMFPNSGMAEKDSSQWPKTTSSSIVSDMS